MTSFSGDLESAGGSELFFKIPDGDTKIRLLSDWVLGYEGWFNKHPVRFSSDHEVTPDEYATFDIDDFNPEKHKYKQFASLIIWNYTTNSVQVWTPNQTTILKQIKLLNDDADWGDPTKYDIKITREKADVVKYTVTPLPVKALDAEIEAALEKSGLDPRQIFSDQKNLDNVKAFETALNAPKDVTDSSDTLDNTPF